MNLFNQYSFVRSKNAVYHCTIFIRIIFTNGLINQNKAMLAIKCDLNDLQETYLIIELHILQNQDIPSISAYEVQLPHISIAFFFKSSME